MNTPPNAGQQLIIDRRAELAVIGTQLAELEAESIALIQACAEHDASALVTISDEAQKALAIEQAGKIKGIAKRIEDLRTKIVGPTNAWIKSVNDFFKPKTEALGQAERRIKDGLNAYATEQENTRRANEARAQAAARKEADDLLARAAKHETAGRVEIAEVLQVQAASTVAAPVASVPVKTKGAHAVTTWSAVVTDIKALCQAVANGIVPANVVLPDMKVLNAMAKALKEHFTNYPGVKATSKTDTAIRAA